MVILPMTPIKMSLGKTPTKPNRHTAFCPSRILFNLLTPRLKNDSFVFQFSYRKLPSFRVSFTRMTIKTLSKWLMMTKIIQTSKIKVASIIYQILVHCLKNMTCEFVLVQSKKMFNPWENSNLWLWYDCLSCHAFWSGWIFSLIVKRPT